MTTSRSIINTIIAGVLAFLGAIAPASADRVFPPAHLSPDAVFDSGTVSDQAVRDAWYHEGESDRRASLKDNETQESSPHPSRYYFAKVRVFPPFHLNGEGAATNEYRDGEPQIVAAGRISNDNS